MRGTGVALPTVGDPVCNGETRHGDTAGKMGRGGTFKLRFVRPVSVVSHEGRLPVRGRPCRPPLRVRSLTRELIWLGRLVR